MSHIKESGISLWRRSATHDESNRSFTLIVQIAMCVALVCGLLFPTNWREVFGILGSPIALAAEIVPSIRKASAVSPNSELIRGYFGFLAFFVPAIAAWIWKVDAIFERVESTTDRFRAAIERPFLAYLLFVPGALLILWLMWELPMRVHLGFTPTRGQTVFALVLNYRVAMAAFGSTIVVGSAVMLWAVTFALWYPFGYLYRK